MNHFPAGETYFSCGNVSFKSPYQSSDVHIHTTLFNKDPNGNTYEAAVSWVEDVTPIGFKACAVTAGAYRDMKTLVVNWMAYEQTPQGSQTGRHMLRGFATGSTCEEVFFSSVGKLPSLLVLLILFLLLFFLLPLVLLPLLLLFLLLAYRCHAIYHNHSC